MALSIIDEKYIETQNGRTVTRAKICVDTASELPAVDGLTGRTLAQGSEAWVISTGVKYALNSSGVWKEQD